MEIYFKSKDQKLYCLLSQEKNSEGVFYKFPSIEGLSDSRPLFDSKALSYKIFFIEENITIKNGEGNWVEIGSKFSLIKDQGKLLLDALSKLWKFMPDGVSYLGANPFYKIPKERVLSEVTFYGGSFNPWHNGHLECLKQCPSPHIIVVPDYNPWKTKAKDDICRYFSFVEIVNHLAFTPFSIYPGFWGRDTPNPTIDWVNNVDIPKKNLLMGDDSFIQILKWKNAKELIKSLDTLYIIRRDFKENDFLLIKNEVLKINTSLNIYYVRENSYSELSSSHIRKN